MIILIILSILAISCASVSAADVDDAIISDVQDEPIGAVAESENVDIVEVPEADDNVLAASIDDEPALGADEPPSTSDPNAISMYEADEDYSENHIYALNDMSDVEKDFLSHFREISSGVRLTNHPIDVFWTPVENNTMYAIFFMDLAKDYKIMHTHLTVNSQDIPADLLIQDMSDYPHIIVAQFSGVTSTSVNAVIETNRNHGKPITIDGVHILNQTNTTLYINDKFEETVYEGEDATLKAIVTLLNFEDVNVTDGTVSYYLYSVNGTQVLNMSNLPNEETIGTSTPGDTIQTEKYPVGDYVFIAWYHDDTQEHNFESHSNKVTLHVIERPKVDLSIEKTVDVENPVFNSLVTFILKVTNSDLNGATGVKVTDLLPAGLEFDRSSDPENYDESTGVWTIGDLAKGASKTLEIFAKVVALGEITNTATITDCRENDTDSSNNVSSATINPIPLFDLEVTKELSEDKDYYYGDEIVYVITVKNNGPCDATDVEVTDKLPAGLKFVSAEGEYDESTGVWTVGDLAKDGSPKTLKITAIIETLETIINNVEITGYEGKDNDTSNNKDDVEVKPLPKFDLAVTIEVTNPEVLCGQAVEYIITVTNNGPCAAYNVIVKDVLPDAFIYITDNSTDNQAYLDYRAKLLKAGKLLETTSSFDQSTGEWAVGDLESGDTLQLAILAKAIKDGEYTITDSVTSDDFEYDTDSTNNEDSATVKVIPCADLSIEKSVDKTEINVGDTVTYTITVTNNGPSDATGVKVTDEDITKHTFVSASSADYDSSTGVWTIGNLSNGESKTLTITVTISQEGKFANTATVTADQEDNDTSNNNASSDNVTVSEVPEDDPKEDPKEDSKEDSEEDPEEVSEEEVPEESDEVPADGESAKEMETSVLPKAGNPILVLLITLIVLTGAMFERKE